MGWFLKFANSSIGKKITMAVTGSFLIIFLIIHLIGNITLFFGPNAFNGYVSILDVIKPLIRVIEVVLLAAFVLHIYNGLTEQKSRNLLGITLNSMNERVRSEYKLIENNLNKVKSGKKSVKYKERAHRITLKKISETEK